MDLNSSVGKICLGEDNRISLNDEIKSHGEWETPECQDTTSSKQKNEAKASTFYKMETKEVSKLCLEHEVKDEDKVVKKELIVASRGEIYFVKFIINPEEDDIELGVILGRSFMRLTKGIADFENGVITIYPKLDPFLDNSDETKKFKDDWELILDDIDFGDIPKLEEPGLPSFVCKLGKSARNKKRPFETVIDQWKTLNTRRSYRDWYKKILDNILLDKLNLDGEIKSEEEEAIKRVMGCHEALKEKEDPCAFVIPIRLEAKVNLNALADTEPMGVLKDMLCQVGVTTIIAKFLILDMHVDKEFCAAKTNVNTEESDSDDDEDYFIKRNSLGTPIYGPKSAKYLNCNDPMDRALAVQEQIYSPYIVDWRVLNKMGFAEEIEKMLEIKVYEVGSQDKIFSSKAWIRAFDINEPIYIELCHKFYSTYDFDEVCTYDKLRTKKGIKFRLYGRANSLTFLEFSRRLDLYHLEEVNEERFDVYFQGGLRGDENFNASYYWLSISSV
uniref:Uncharacterized protein n=1 Tax=Tanacetum cinerariifolium TaxID=118510 RepID=A0A6L2M0T3_TANCI|nr:hypothetical protein [Tanacetum cinerariifolium]